MPPRGVKSPKRKRQYEHIKQSVEKRGGGAGRAKRIAAATVNKQRRAAGETKGSRLTRSRTASRRSAQARPSARKRTGTRRRTSRR